MHFGEETLKGKPLKVFVIDDDKDITNILVESLRFSDFEARGFNSVEEMISSVFPTTYSMQDIPDLFIVDLELGENRRNGIDLIKELASQDVPSEIISITGYRPSSDLIDNLVCFGASSFITKPFSIFQLCDQAEKYAKIGRNRRIRRLQTENVRFSLTDEERLQRPVFLSYADEDRLVANGIRRHMEFRGISLWYAPTSIDKGAEWRKEIEAGIDKARVFVALLTDSYLKSPYCVGELTRFKRRIERDTESKLLFLPVLGAVSDEVKNIDENLKQILQVYQCINFHPRLTDGLTVLSIRIEKALYKRRIDGHLR